LSEYVDRIRHVKGKDNVVADALSRNPVPPVEAEPNYLDDDPDVLFTPVFGLIEGSPTLSEIKEEQEKTKKRSKYDNKPPLVRRRIRMAVVI